MSPSPLARILPGLGTLLLIGFLGSGARAADPSPAPWHDVPGGRRRALPEPRARADRPEGFTPLDPNSLGFHWTNQLSAARYATRQNLMNGAGLAFADVDDDGWCDVFLCNKEGASALFRNLGNWQFTNITETAGVASAHLIATGAVFGDVNGDRRPDLLVTSFLGPDALYLNLGGGRFTNVTAAAGVASKGGTTSAAFADLDGDGDLDLYVAHFGIEAILRDGAVITTRNVGGKPTVMGRFSRRLRIVDGRMIEYGEPDVLFLNDGRGTFTPAPAGTFVDEDGQPLAELPPDFGLSIQIRDLDGNGTPDLYLCNDFQTPDRIWLGDGRGRFRAAPRSAFRNMSYASMGVDCADLDRDGHLEIFTVEMLSRDPARHLSQRSPMDPAPRAAGVGGEREAVPRNVLQWNRGDGSYADIAWYAGVAMSDWSWSPVFLDVDLDGFEDLLVSNGHMHDVNDMDVNATRSRDPAQRAQETAQQVLLAYPRLETPNAAWRNRGDLTFEDRAAAWNFNALSITHGLALADLDNDGDADVIGNAWREPPLVCRNDAAAPRIAVRLRGAPGNPHGVGARVRLRGGPVPLQEQEIHAGGRYLSSDQPQLTFAARTSQPLSLEVLWRSGRRTEVTGVQPNHLYELHESAALPPASPAASPPPGKAPWLSEWTPAPSLIHTESEFDDFARQPLLPRRLSRLGPALASLTTEQGTELILGGSRGGRLQTVQVDAQGRMKPGPEPAADPLPDDTAGLLVVELTPGRPSLLAALATFESGDALQPSVLRFDRVDGRWQRGASLPAIGASPGALAAADLDGDGDPDVVVAGRMIPGRYPEPADTQVFRNDAGVLVADAERSSPLARVGLVTGLALADFDGDRRTDLALSCEWGSPRLFLNRGKAWEEATAAVGLASHTGLWQCLIAADLDGDGRTDLACGNWGKNSFHQRTPAGPWELAYGDFDGDGTVSILEGCFHPDRQAMMPLRLRDTLARDLPWLAASFPRNRDFATATVPRILEAHAAEARTIRATSLASTVFLNRPGRFEPFELPPEAQWTPISALAAADLDADGRSELIAAQNLFALRDEDDRLDAGLGLVLTPRGPGLYRALKPGESGLRVPGEQRALITTDLDRDGHTDVVVTQNAGPTAFWKSRSPSGKRP